MLYLFGQGWEEQRYVFDAEGHVIPYWVDCQCQYTLVPLLAGLLVSVELARPVWAVPVSAAEQQLIHQIKQGEALFRDDIVNDAVQHLYRVSPQHPQGLLAELRLALRLDQLELAQAKLAQLQQSAPSSEEYADANLLMRLTDPKQEVELAQARLISARWAVC